MLEQATDSESDGHISTQEKYDALSRAMGEYWDLIDSCGLGEKHLKTQTFNTVAGQLEYNCQTVCTDLDFYRVHTLYVNEGNGHYRPLQRISPHEVFPYTTVSSVIPMKLVYMPNAPKITALASAVDGVNGWEEFVIASAAFHIKAKKDDANIWERRKQEVARRIQTMGQVDLGEPMRVSRKRYNRNRGMSPFSPFYGQVNAYLVRGDKIELYYYNGFNAW